MDVFYKAVARLQTCSLGTCEGVRLRSCLLCLEDRLFIMPWINEAVSHSHSRIHTNPLWLVSQPSDVLPVKIHGDMMRLSLSHCSRLLFSPFQSAAIAASPSSQIDIADTKDERTHLLPSTTKAFHGSQVPWQRAVAIFFRLNERV